MKFICTTKLFCSSHHFKIGAKKIAKMACLYNYYGSFCHRYYFWNFWILLVSFVLKMKDKKSLRSWIFILDSKKKKFFWQVCLFVIENLLHFWINFAHNVIFRPLISDQESGKIFPPFDWKDLSNPFVIFFFQIPNSNLYNKVQKKVTYVFPRDNSWYYNIICIFFFKLFSIISFKICLKMG